NPQHGLQFAPEVAHRLGGQGPPRFRLELARAPVLLDFLSRTLDRVLLSVEEVLDQHDQLYFATLVDTVPGAILGRVQEPELALPVAQHMRLEIGELADFADRE